MVQTVPVNETKNILTLLSRMGLIKSIVNTLSLIAQFLVLVGALNWGLMGLFKKDAIVILIPSHLVRSVHITVGVAALFLILLRFL